MKIVPLFLILLSILVPPVFAAPDTAELLAKMDEVLRGPSHEMTVTLDVKTKNWERHYQLQVWMKGVDRTFARVLKPAKSAGQGFLRIESRLWNYLPTAERTILIPPSLMLDRFMGSDFSNDDFVKLTYLPRDYDATIVGEEKMDDFEVYRLELKPHPDAPVIYGKLELWLRRTDAAPVRTDFYNEKMELIRTLHYSGFRTFGEHEIPSVWRMENVKEKDRQTVVTILDAAFGVQIPDPIFTREHLEKF